MNFLQEVFGSQSFTFSEFVEAVKASGLKIGNLSSGQYIDRRKYNAAKYKLDAAEKKIREMQKQMDEIHCHYSAKQQKLWKHLQEEYYTRTMASLLECALDMELLCADAKDAEAVKALLDHSKVSYENGRLTGLAAQMASLKKDKPYLFD